MAVIKIACPSCGQKVSGDETFYGRTVRCPACEAKIVFPDNPVDEAAPAAADVPAKSEPREAVKEVPSFDDVPPQAMSAATSMSASTSSETENSGFDSREASGGSPIWGILALVVGVLNIITLCLPGILLAPVAVILGHVGLAKAKNYPIQPGPGRNIALVGTILGYAGILGTIILLISVLLSKDMIVEVLVNAGILRKVQ